MASSAVVIFFIAVIHSLLALSCFLENIFIIPSLAHTKAMLQYLACTLILAAAAQASGSSGSIQTETALLLTSGSGWIQVLSFNGTGLNSEDVHTYPGGIASWLIDGIDGSYWLANNESGSAVNKFASNPSHDNVTYQQVQGQDGAAGVVHFEYNLNKTRMFGAGYGSQTIDIWNTTAAGTVQHLASIPTNDTSSHPHQTVQSPCGRYAVVNDLGLDKLHILDTTDDDAIHIAGSVAVPAGCGPRHGAFYMAAGTTAPTRYLVVCETSHQVLVLNATGWPAAGASTSPVLQTLDTALDGPAGVNLTAAELVLFTNPDRSADVYVSNRLTGDATDSVAHFRLPAPAPDDQQQQQQQQPGDLAGVGLASTGGVGPRGMSLSPCGQWLLVGNQQAGPAGLVVLGRNATSGALDAVPVASLAYKEFAAGAGGEEGYGPQFVMSWGAGWAGGASSAVSSNASASRPTPTGTGMIC